MEENNIIIYNTDDGKAKVVLYAKDGNIWMNQNQMAELFDTSKQNIGQHISNILSDNELNENSVVKNYFTTASDGKYIKMRTNNIDDHFRDFTKMIYLAKGAQYKKFLYTK